MSNADTHRPILLVDDNPDDLYLTRRLLAKAGIRNPVRSFQCSLVACGHLRRLAETRATSPADLPFAVILDGNMPGMSGVELLTVLRGLDAFAGVNLIMLSGSDLPEDRQRALEHGANTYLVKFPEPSVLAQAVAADSALVRD